LGITVDVMSVSQRQPRVLIYRPQDSTGDSHRRLERAGCRVIVVEADEDLGRALESHAPVDGLLAASLKRQRLDRRLLDELPELRIVSKYTIGVDDVDVEAATELGILVTHCPTEANWGGVAEGTIALMLALLKKVEARSVQVKRGGWRGDELRGTYLGSREDGYPGITLGIVGFGRIGRRVAELMAPWKIRILATDPYVDPSEFDRYGVKRAGLDGLLSESDVVSVHCALTEETGGLIDRVRIGLMQPHALLINTARGPIVDVDAVCDALDSGRLGGAAFDVLPSEPPPADSRILRADHRVLLSPHMVAANKGGTLAAAVPWATDAVLAALAGRVPPHVYNEAVIDRWTERFGDKPMLEARAEEGAG
jgi:phosphoglycerate dehydrogenase-like enzyme